MFPAVAYSVLLLAADPSLAADDIGAVIERSLPFIEAEGQRWIDEKKCVTCHQVPFMVWSLNSAYDRGFKVDRQKLDEWNAWATDWKHMANKEQLDKGDVETLSRQHDSVAQLLLGSSRLTGKKPQRTLLADCLALGQLEDGSWKAGGQLPSQKRPERETNEVTTMWALVALKTYVPAEVSVQSNIDKARAWLGTETRGQSTEWWTVRLLLDRGGAQTEAADSARAALLKNQHEDGGWGWLLTDESDAFGTGLALYALLRDGVANDDAVIANGQKFLVHTQSKDGSWPVKGTKKNKSQQIEPTATYWGTCWAVIGLLETQREQ